MNPGNTADNAFFDEGRFAMNYRTTYILFGTLLGILVLVGLAWWFTPEYVDTSSYLLPERPRDQADHGRSGRARGDRPGAAGGADAIFERDADGDKWEITSPLTYRANNSVVEGLVSGVLDARQEAQADVPANGQAAELEPPAEVVTLKTKDGKELKVNFGKEAAPGPGAVVYASTPDRPNQVVPVLKSTVEAAFKKVNDFRDPYLLAASASDYQFVKLTLDKTDKKDAPKGSLVLDKKEEGLWEYKDPEGYDGSAEEGDVGAPSDPHKPPSGVNGLLKALAELRVDNTDKTSDFVEDDAKDLAKYNLDPTKSDVLVIDVDRIESLAKDEGAAGKPKTVPVKLLIGVGKKVDDKTDKYYAALQGEHGNTVVKVAADGPESIELLFKDPTLLCNHNLAALGAFKKPVAVNVTNASGKLEFRRENGDSLDWRLYRDGEEVAADGQAVQRLRQPAGAAQSGAVVPRLQDRQRRETRPEKSVGRGVDLDRRRREGGGKEGRRQGQG